MYDRIHSRARTACRRENGAGVAPALFAACVVLAAAPSAQAADEESPPPAVTTGALPTADTAAKGGEDGTTPTAGTTAPEQKEAAKWWGIGISFATNHGVDKDHPTAQNALSIDPSATLPWYPIRFSLHLGASQSIEYGRQNDAGKPLKDFYTYDLDVTVLSVGIPIHKFADAGISFGSSLKFFIPYTSRFDGRRHEWMFAYEPGLSASFSKWGLSLGGGVNFRQNVHRYDTLVDSTTGEIVANYTQYRVSGSGSLGYSRWGVSLSLQAAVVRSWVYREDLQEQEKVAVQFGGELGYEFSETGVDWLAPLSLAVGVTTAGPERRNGGFGNDQVVPLDPRYTSVYGSIALNY